LTKLGPVQTRSCKPSTSRLVDAAAAGEEILIARAGKPVARLVALQDAQARPRRRLGLLAGKVSIPADFDAPLPEDILASFEGR
jgi:prevent-host-death family protein